MAKICIDIPGSIYEGLDSPERGESRWAQNWAKFLAEEGHQVLGICYPGLWGNSRPVPNVELRSWTIKKPIECDIYINCCWWRGRDIGDVKAKTYVHMAYSLEGHMKDPTFITKGHVLAYPYELSKKNFIHEVNPFSYKTFCLPVPLAQDFGPSAFNRKALVFSAKDVFLDRHTPNETYWYDIGRDTIKTMASLSEQYDLPCYFMMANELTNTSMKAVKDNNILSLLASIPNKRLFNLLPLREVYNILSDTKILFPVVSPGGSMIEGVMRGVVPLTYQSSLFDLPAREEGFLLDGHSAYQQIRDAAEKLIIDETFYNRILSKYQTILEGHLYPNSRSYFQKLLDFTEE